MEAVKKNDFVEIEFTGRANGEIFDTTDKQGAKSIGLDADVKPIIISVGNEMILKGLDEQLEEKELNKKYSFHLTPEQGFGVRNPKLIKTIPLKVFREKNINPMPGMSFQMDQYLVKILSVSGGRVIADFNNPLSGKELDYELIIKRKITDNSEKVNALQDFFFKQRFEFTANNNKIIFKEQRIKPIIEMFRQKFKDITGLDFEIGERKEESRDDLKKQENKQDTLKRQ